MKLIMTVCCHVDLCGADLSMLTALKGLKEHGYHIVVLLTRHGRIEENLRNLKIEYYIIPQNGCITNRTINQTYFLPRKIYNWLFFLKHEILCDIKLYRFIKSFPHKPDVIYTNTILPTTGIFLSQYYRIPHIMHIRELVDDDFHFIYYIGKKFYLKILKWNLTYAICISKAVLNKFQPFLKDKSILIYNGIPEIVYPTSNHDTSKVKLLFVGRLSKEKGIMELIQAIISLKRQGINNIILDIWGEGVDRCLLEDTIKKEKLENFIFLKGYAPSMKIPRQNYDIAIMPSPHEAFGRVTVEFMMAGLPVIGCNGGATSEIIENGISGLLYNSITELVSQLQVLIVDKDKRKLLGQNAKIRAKLFFSEQAYINNINNLFDSLWI